MTGMTLSEELRWRGFVNQTTLNDLSNLDEGKWIFYHGYDASSDSLTIGNLAALMMDKAFIRHGHKAIILAGGATSLIGDPGGKDAERILQDETTIAKNVLGVKEQIEKLFGDKVHVLNNIDWFKSMNALEFLRDVGKHFSMTPLVQRDYIATRMGESGVGISYTEFSYTLLQGYDFLHLYQKYGVELQLAGSDQWGNSVSGVELVRRVTGKQVHALTMPLILNKATGKKFGKSETGAVWLNPNKTSVYQFYQFWLNIDDEGVENYIKIFTELNKPQIDAVMTEFHANKGGRAAQKLLAYEVTKLVHGKKEAESQKLITGVLFGSDDPLELGMEEFMSLVKELPITSVPRHMTIDHLAGALVATGLASSKTEARRFLNEGAIYINNIQIANLERFLYDSPSNHAVIRRGKNQNAVLKITL